MKTNYHSLDGSHSRGYSVWWRWIYSLSYLDSNVILFCFSLDSPPSLKNIETRWLLETKKYCPDVPTILIGNKKDLRYQADKNKLARGETYLQQVEIFNCFVSDSGNIITDFVTYQQGKEMAENIGALKWQVCECSAKTMHGLNKNFPTAGHVALQVSPSGTRWKLFNFHFFERCFSQ